MESSKSKIYESLLHTPGVTRRWASLISHTSLPLKISIFLWKLFRHALPVDTRIQSRGINMASRCQCCEDTQEESIPHLFLRSQLAIDVWAYFGKIFRLPESYFVIWGLLHTFFMKFGLLGFKLSFKVSQLKIMRFV